MAVFLSRAPGYRTVVRVGEKTIVLRFSNGVLDTTAAAKRHASSGSGHTTLLELC